jgi:hypothetical protein
MAEYHQKSKLDNCPIHENHESNIYDKIQDNYSRNVPSEHNDNNKQVYQCHC